MKGWVSDRVGLFAEKSALTWADQENIGDVEVFRRLWNLGGEAGLCRVGIPEAYGGVGGGGLELSETLQCLAYKTGNLGLPLAVMISQIVAHFMVGGLGSEAQKAAWLPAMARGDFPSSFAVSEAKVGAHPKKLSTHAVETAGIWHLEGAKSYISNGPMAGLMVVVAVVGESHGRKSFSAFLVGEDVPGVDRSEAMSLPFFRPAQHGTVRFDGVELEGASILGEPGRAYTELVLPFRRYEDAMMMGCVTGALMFVLDRIGGSGAPFDEGVCGLLGALKAHVTALELVARESARLTGDASVLAVERSTALLIHFRAVAGICREILDSLEGAGLLFDSQSRVVMEDLKASAGIAANISTAKQVKFGKTCLTPSR